MQSENHFIFYSGTPFDRKTTCLAKHVGQQKIDRFYIQRGGITVEFREMWGINKKGRCFQNGKPISPNRRCNIVDEIKFKILLM